VDALVTQPGPAAEEAAKLFAAVEDWVRTRGAGLLHGEHLSTGAPECTVCPLCQGVAALRQVTPETVEHLLDAAASLVAALRTTVAPAPRPDSHRSGVQHIDVREG